MGSDELFQELNLWAEEVAKISPSKKFSCEFIDSCNASADGNVPADGSQTCMSYVGPRYGALENDLRLVIVGLDHGNKEFRPMHAEGVSFKAQGLSMAITGAW